MNFNYAMQNSGVLAWTPIQAAPVSAAVDIRHHIGFAFTFQVTADIAVEAVFNVQSAPPSGADPCLPGTFVPVPEVLTCVSDFGATPGAQASIHIPVGTKAGSICTASLPCKPDAFIKLVAGSGDTGKVLVVTVLHGPR